VRRLSGLAVDLSPLRESRELRLLLVGWVVSGLGTQAALVALPYQVYVQTGSELLVGLLGAVELVPVMAMALLGGAIADRFDRRRLLLLDQAALVLTASALAACTFAGWTPVAVLFVLAGLLAGSGPSSRWSARPWSRASPARSCCDPRSRSTSRSRS
jgi:MFS family permease